MAIHADFDFEEQRLNRFAMERGVTDSSAQTNDERVIKTERKISAEVQLATLKTQYRAPTSVSSIISTGFTIKNEGRKNIMEMTTFWG